MTKDQNETAKSQLDDEMKALGLGNHSTASTDDEDDQDMGPLDDEDIDEGEEDDSDEDDADENSDESDEEDSDDEDDEEDEDEESDEDSPRSKRKIPFKVHNQLRKDFRKAQTDLKTALENNQKLADKLPDDFQERMDVFTKELGVQDPDTLKKIIGFVKEFGVDKNTAKLEKQIADLEVKIAANKPDIAVVDEFPTEWEAFETTFFQKEFPNATPAQLKEAKQKMHTLSHTKNIGGKSYIDPKSGKEALDPYPLDYIYFKNRSDFEAIVTGKKFKGMESTRTQGIKTSREVAAEKGGVVTQLPKNASAAEIRKMDKQYTRMEVGSDDNLRSPENSTI